MLRFCFLFQIIMILGFFILAFFNDFLFQLFIYFLKINIGVFRFNFLNYSFP